MNYCSCRKVLKSKITDAFGCPVHHPANGQVIFINEEAKEESVVISSALKEARMSCIESAARAVFSCSQIEDEQKLKLIAESAKIQGRPESIAWDGYWFWDGTLDSPPTLLSAAEFAQRVGKDLESLFELKKEVKRFITDLKLMELVSHPDDPNCRLSALQAFLIE